MLELQDPEVMLARGTIVAGYRIERLIGRGGMGAVYEATQLSLSRPIALKLLAPHLGEDPVFRERFRREGVIQAALDHAHIVPIYEAGESEEGLFLAMRLVRGANLKDLIGSGELTPDRALAVLEQAASALDAAHAAGLVHRDVKPQNVLVAEGDYAYLADFGLTKAPGEGGLTASGHQVGSLDYISPEQIRGEPVTPKSDLYAFGVVMYEALAGAVPYPRDSDAALIYAHLEQPAPKLSEQRPGFPSAVDSCISAALAKTPEERPLSASALVEGVERALAGASLSPVEVASPPRLSSETFVDVPIRRPVTPAPVSGPPRSRAGRWLVLAGACAVAVALGAGVLTGRAAGEVSLIVPARVAASGVSILQPHGWSEAPAPKLGGLPLSDAFAVVPSRKAESGVAIGTFTSSHPSLLPKPLLAQLRTVPRAAVVRLGGLTAYRYDAIVVGKRSLTIFTLPTGERVTSVVCFAARPARIPPECSRVAASVRVTSRKIVALGPSPAIASSLTRLTTRLRKDRKSALGSLGRATRSRDQALAARRVAAAYVAAAGSTRSLPVRFFEQPGFAVLARELRALAESWNALAVAAEREDSSRYSDAAKSIRARESALARRFTTLSSYGYGRPH